MPSYFKNINFRYLAITFLVITMLVCKGLAQERQIFPSEEIFDNDAFEKRINISVVNEKAVLNGYTKKQITLINEQIKYRSEFLTNLMTSGELMFESPLQDYVDKVFKSILDANPDINKDYRVYVSRSAVPNAFNVGGGFIIINVGILERLHNEAELVFVLAHELSHQVLDHVNQNIVDYAIANTDKARKEQLKKILQSKYRVYSQLENLILPGLTKEMGFRRSLELQADSLGLLYYLHASQPVRGPLDAMLLLDIIDTDEDTSLIDFKTFFAKDSIQFNASWLRYGNASSLTGIIQMQDTLEEILQTHPDALYRFEILSGMIQKNDLDTLPKIPIDMVFRDIQLLARMENIHGLYLNGSYSRAFFAAIKTIEAYPGQKYPHQIAALILGRLSFLKVAKKAGIFLDLNNKEFSEAYNRTISFLWEINSKDCAQLSYWMMRPSSDEKTRYGLEALLYSSMAMDRKKEFRALFSQYKRSFSNTPQAEEFADYLETSN